MGKSVLSLLFALLLAATSCGSSDGDTPAWAWGNDSTSTKAKPRYIWIDACANFPDYANSKDNIERDLTKVKNAGFTDIVVDVRPSMGDALFSTSAVDQVTKLDVWIGSVYQFYQRTATWDYLQAFIDIGHKLGLKVNASIDTFVGGNLYSYGLGEQGMLFRDSSKKGWATTLNMSSGLTNEMDLNSTNDPDNTYGTKFLNPANDDVQTFALQLLKDLAKYNLDGIFLDRCRYDDMMSDFSDESRQKFESYIGTKVTNYPSDIMLPGTTSLPSTQPTYFKKWLEFRVKVIHDFVVKARAAVKSVNDTVKFGTYVGAWYSTYYESGVNWASPKYNTAADYPTWATADYSTYGYADHLDFMLLGAYASTDNIYGTGEWTMQGFCTNATNLLKGDVKFAGGPDVGNATGWTNGGQSAKIPQTVDACINAGNGYFLFDICHVKKYDYWAALKTGIDNYLKTVK
jgi:uncharacterized lipoprotein YddW (UPF0748 family)